jgi:hypothetical protein
MYEYALFEILEIDNTYDNNCNWYFKTENKTLAFDLLIRLWEMLENYISTMW